VTECYLCGDPSTTVDHVPPKTFFPRPAPSNLITLPACHKCNTAYSKDEEYLRNNVVIASNPEQTKGELWGRTKRGIRRRPALRADMVRRIIPVQVEGKTLPALKYDAARAKRVLVKIARGLVFRHAQRRLPDSVFSDAFPLESVPPSLHDAIPKLPCRGWWEGTFAYVGGMSKDDPDVGLWVISFYLSRAFVVQFDSIPPMSSDKAQANL